MRFSIQGTNIEINKALRVWVERKLGSLERLHPDLESKQVVEVELEKTTTDQRKGRIFRAEAQFMLGGKLFRGESYKEDIREAVIEVNSQLEKRLKRFKGKQERAQRNGARQAKRIRN